VSVVKTDAGKVVPTNLRSLRNFVGIVGFYARFIPGYANIVDVLHGLKEKGVRFEWDEQHHSAFEYLKRALCEVPVLKI